MKLRVGLTGDLHVDNNNKLAPLSDQVRLLEIMLDEWRNANVDVIVVSGDVYERGSEPAEREAASEFLIRAADIAPVAGIKGNHDINDDVMIFNRLRGRFPITFAQRPHIATLPTCELHLLPWFDKGPMMAKLPAGLSIEQTNRMVIESGKGLLRTMAGRVNETRMKGLIPLAVWHGMVSGSEVSTGQRIRGETIEFNPADLLDINAAAVLLGHIHNAFQDWDARVTYPGSPYRTDHGENEAKGFRIIEIESEGRSYRVDNRFIELPARKLTHLEFDESAAAGGLASLIQQVRESAAGQVAGSLVRLRLRVSPEDAHKVDEDALSRALYDAGAFDVQVECINRQEARVRSEAIAVATAGIDKLAAFWESKGIDPDSETRRRIRFKVDELERQSGSSSVDHLHSGEIKLISSELQGCTSAFRKRVRIDWSRLPDGLIAVTGPNGAGKTTLIDSTHASVYRKFAFRPKSFYNIFRGTDGFAASTWEHRTPAGKSTLRTSVQVNAGRRKTEQYFSVNGEKEPIKNLENWFESAQLVLAGPYQCQKNTHSLPELSAAERKEVFAEMLQLNSLQEISRLAGERRKTAASELDKTRALLTTVEEEIRSLGDVSGLLAGSQARVADLQERLETARGAEAEARAALEQATSAGREIEQCEQLYLATVRARETAERNLAELEVRHVREKESLSNRIHDIESRIDPGGAKKIEHSYARKRAAIEKEIQTLEERAARLAGLVEAETRLAGLRTEYQELIGSKKKTEAAILGVERAASDVGLKRQANEMACEAWEREIAGLERQAGPVNDASCATDISWISEHGDRPAGGASLKQTGVNLKAICPLLAGARAAAAELEARKSKRPAEPESLKRSEQNLIIAKAELAKLPSVESIDAALNELERSAAAIKTAAVPAGGTVESETALARDALIRLPVLRDGLESLEAERSSEMSGFLQRQEQAREALSTARSEQANRIAIMQTDEESSGRDAASARNEESAALAALKKIKSRSKGIQLAEDRIRTASAARENAELLLKTAAGEVSRLTERETHLLAKQDRQTGLQRAAAAREEELGDWKLIETGFGKNGIQTLLMDSAAPEISSICNELLEVYYGPRFQIQLQTLRENVDGSSRESLEIRVIDNAGKWEGFIEDPSGGEQVLIGSVLNLAVAIFNSLKSGVRYLTLRLDEPDTGLDGLNTAAFARMLRQARERGRYEQVIVVTHSQELAGHADGRVCVKDGRVSFGEDQTGVIAGAAA